MDTRAKIITPAEAQRLLAEFHPRVVSGYFNPLRAEHARRLREVAAGNGRPLLVVVQPADSPLLDGRARTELVAALAVVDYVVSADSGAPLDWLGRVPPQDRLDLGSADERLTKDLVCHVLSRHS